MSRAFRFVLVTSMYVALISSSPILADSFPVTAFLQEASTVHSGPSEKFYATQFLDAGTKVEIYKTKEGGWCGIRPLTNSFSLIPADATVATADPNILRINREGIRTQVGSLVSSKHDVKYVTLHKGEPVKSIGRTNDGRWIKISPPSGEFRWVHRRFLGSEKPSAETVSTAKASAQTTEETPPSTNQDHVRLASFDTDIPNSEPVGSSVQNSSTSKHGSPSSPKPIQSPPSIGTDLVADAKPIASQMQTVPIESHPEPSDSLETKPAKNAVVSQQAASASAWKAQAPSTHEKTVTPPSALAASAGGSIQAQIGKLSPDVNKEIKLINVALSQTVMQETSKWDLAEVRMRTERVIDTSRNQADRQSGRELLSRIAEFENLKRRYDQMSGRSLTPPALSTVTATRAPASRIDKTVGRQNVELTAFLKANNRSAGSSVRQATHTEPSSPRAATAPSKSGWLMPVITSNPHMPKFAITDDEGKILCFVSQGSGVNLKQHLRQHVTLMGESNFSRQLKKTHLVATRVMANR